MKHPMLWSAILAGVSPLLIAQGELNRPDSLVLQDTAAVGDGSPAASVFQLPQQVTPIHTAPDDPEGGAYGVWGAGQNYKVSFHGSPTFVPYLGADYPHNQPLTWHLESVTAGGDELLTGDAPTRSHSGCRYEYRYGAVTEAYDVRLDGLEQSFVIAQRPSSAGDLVVSMRVAGHMEPTEFFSDEHRAAVFADAQGAELVRYGEAFIVDATGNKQPIGTTIAGDIICLRVPASMIANAKFPLTVDPLTTPIQINAGAAILTTDVVRTDRTDRVCLTYTRAVSSADSDCWGWNCADGVPSLGTLVFTDITSSWSTSQASCACIGSAAVNRFIIAITRRFSTSTAIRVWSQITSSPVLDTSVVGLASGGSHNWNIDCGGIEGFDQNGNGSNGDKALVIFQKDPGGFNQNSPSSDVYALIVNGSFSGITVGPAEVPVRMSPNRDTEYPSVTKVSEGTIGTSPTTWLVACQEYSSTIPGDDWDALALRVFASGGVAGGSWSPTVNAGAHKIDVQIEGQRGRYLVTYGRVDEVGPLTKISGLRSNQLANERFDWPLGGTITNYPAHLVTANLGRFFRVSDVGFDADSDSIWTTAWRVPGLATERGVVARVGHTGAVLDLASIRSTAGVSPSRAGICYNDDANNFLLAFGRSDGLLFRTEMNMLQENFVPLVSGMSCSGAAIGWELQDALGVTVSNQGVDQQVGFEFGTITASGMPASAVSVLGVSLASSNTNIGGIPGVGVGCRDLIATQSASFLGFLDIRLGASGQWQLPLPEFVTSSPLRFQVFHLNGSGNQFLSTRSLLVPIY